MSFLCWDKPKKVRTTEEHNNTFVADGAPPGTFVPNMSEDDKRKWKAKLIRGADPRVEIRKTTDGKRRGSEQYGHYAQVLLVIREDGTVVFSANGKAELSVNELIFAIAEASDVLADSKYKCPKCKDTGTVRWQDDLGWQSYLCDECIGGK